MKETPIPLKQVKLKMLNVEINWRLHKKLKQMAMDKNTTMVKLVTEWIKSL